ncbi:MAG: sugar ABC transporter permease [Sphaerochaetaceae bacterium]|nr:sugar ABC transporter permease [Sphaerochaetaceae bacterium]
MYRLGRADMSSDTGTGKMMFVTSQYMKRKLIALVLRVALVSTFPLTAAGAQEEKSVEEIELTFFYPAVMPMIVIESLWMFIYMPDAGFLDQLLTTFGFLPAEIPSFRNTVKPAMAFMFVWREAGLAGPLMNA